MVAFALYWNSSSSIKRVQRAVRIKACVCRNPSTSSPSWTCIQVRWAYMKGVAHQRKPATFSAATYNARDPQYRKSQRSKSRPIFRAPQSGDKRCCCQVTSVSGISCSDILPHGAPAYYSVRCHLPVLKLRQIHCRCLMQTRSGVRGVVIEFA